MRHCACCPKEQYSEASTTGLLCVSLRFWNPHTMVSFLNAAAKTKFLQAKHVFMCDLGHVPSVSQFAPNVRILSVECAPQELHSHVTALPKLDSLFITINSFATGCITKPLTSITYIRSLDMNMCQHSDEPSQNRSSEALEFAFSYFMAGGVHSNENLSLNGPASPILCRSLAQCSFPYLTRLHLEPPLDTPISVIVAIVAACPKLKIFSIPSDFVALMLSRTDGCLDPA
eukprot:20144_1